MTRLPFPSYPIHTRHWWTLRAKWSRMFGTTL